MRKFIVLMGAAAFTPIMAGFGSALTDDGFFYGSITKIQGKPVTIKSNADLKNLLPGKVMETAGRLRSCPAFAVQKNRT